jgi:prevent-host-death family protein
MKQVGVKQARQELPGLIDMAEAGEEVVITRQGKPVARLIAATKSLKALPSLANFRDRLKVGISAVRLLRDERNAG